MFWRRNTPCYAPVRCTLAVGISVNISSRLGRLAVTCIFEGRVWLPRFIRRLYLTPAKRQEKKKHSSANQGICVTFKIPDTTLDVFSISQRKTDYSRRPSCSIDTKFLEWSASSTIHIQISKSSLRNAPEFYAPTESISYQYPPFTIASCYA